MNRFPRPSMRRVVIVVPSLFTLFNLFFGVWAMVLASRAEFYKASWYIFFAGMLDTLDGRVARLSKTGTRFGAELDSLVDAVSFGVAPAFLIYQLEFASAGQAEWIFCYFYVMAATIRLARFNITQAGRAKHSFIGLPSPAAGMTLATFYPFTTTDLYQQVFRYIPRHHAMQFLMIFLTILMVSNVRYATLPRAGLRTMRGLLGLATIVFILVFGIREHDAFFFPLGVAYMAYGVLRATVLGFFFEAGEDEEAEIAGPIVISDRDPAKPEEGGGHVREIGHGGVRDDRDRSSAGRRGGEGGGAA
ncbi:MAG TPA: CDP-diacylglycerol--serine O-phosphatidyltransferase [Gemmatimonadales bacterium]|nr:CDP-diacylglycerol--serine O-phosphatidyltransferase [Gemmatimonadales bacterium]